MEVRTMELPKIEIFVQNELVLKGDLYDFDSNFESSPDGEPVEIIKFKVNRDFKSRESWSKCVSEESAKLYIRFPDDEVHAQEINVLYLAIRNSENEYDESKIGYRAISDLFNYMPNTESSEVSFSRDTDGFMKRFNLFDLK